MNARTSVPGPVVWQDITETVPLVTGELVTVRTIGAMRNGFFGAVEISPEASEQLVELARRMALDELERQEGRP